MPGTGDLSVEAITRGLATRWMGRVLHVYETIDSTNTKALQAAGKGEPEGAVFIADEQSAGRGRLGRSWVSPRGASLSLSVIVRPRVPPIQVPLVTLLTAISVAQAIREVTGVSSVIKWPNDVLINGRKVAGILTELRAEQDVVQDLVIGIGVNVNMGGDALPEDVRTSATSLKEETGRETNRSLLLCVLLQCLENWYEMFQRGERDRIIREWLRTSDTIGRWVRVSAPGEVMEGEATGITPHGALILRQRDGTERNIYSGDVIHVRAGS